MANVNPMFVNTDGLPEEMQDDDTLDLGGLVMTGDITMGGNEVTGLPSTPSGVSAAASKAYVDAVAQGLNPKEACRLATTAALSTWTAAGSGVGKTLTAPNFNASNNDFDGVTAALGDRVLVKDGGPNATPAIDNGIYEVTALGNGVDAATELTRADDFDGSPSSEVAAGDHVWVTEGSTQDDTAWVVTTNNPITVDTTAINWSQYGGQGALTGGNGIDISAGVVSVDLATGAVLQPGLQFGSGADAGKLAVDPGNGVQVTAAGVEVDPGAGITVDANGVNVNAGDGLVATLGGDLDIDLTATPGLEFSGGDLQVLVDPAGAIDRIAAGLHVRTDDSTIQINGSNELEVIGAGDATRLAEEVTANENLSVGDPVFWGGANDEVRESQAGGAGRRKVVGVMEDGPTATNTGTMVRRGIVQNVLTGATVGTRYFLASGGGLTTTPPTASGEAVWFIGHAVNATDLDVQPQFISIRA